MGKDKVDYLEVDDPINGQSYVCLSFVSPEEMIQRKEAFNTAKFLQSIAHEKDKDFKYFYNLYEDFVYKYSDKLQKDFEKDNKLKTNIRALKVRGVYSSEDEARSRAKKLQLKDSTFNVFVAPVGYWLPWDPNPDSIEEEEFLNDELNNLIKEYKKNQTNKDILYEQDKREKMKENLEKELKEQESTEQESTEQESTESPDTPEGNSESELVGGDNKELIDEIVNGSDPWMNKVNVESESEPVDEEAEQSPEPESEPVDEEVEKSPEPESEPVDEEVEKSE